jgi:preprotein translocase subunit SecA
MNIPKGEEIQYKSMSNMIEKAQKRIENNNYGIRKNLLDYDQVMNEQREVIYAERRRVLDGESMRDVMFGFIDDTATEIVGRNISDEVDPSEWDMKGLNQELTDEFPMEPIEYSEEELKSIKAADVVQKVKEEVTKLYEAKETGRNRCVVYHKDLPSEPQKAKEEKAAENVHPAFAKDNNVEVSLLNGADKPEDEV